MLKALFATLILLSSAAFAADLKVFGDRAPERMAPIFQAFTAKTGVKVGYLQLSYADMKTRLQGGEKADLLLMKDIVFFTDAAQSGLLQPMNAANRQANVPAEMIDPSGLWIGLAYRVRTAAVDPTVVGSDRPVSYEDLASSRWANSLCMRNGKDYMPALVAWMVARFGEAKAEALVRGWKINMAMDFTAGDTVSLQSINSGQCVATITNHYYLARLKKADSRFPVELQFLDQNLEGVHTNGFAAGVAKSAESVEQANQLIAHLLTPQSQQTLILDPSFEYPALKSEQPVDVVRAFGGFKSSTINWATVGENLATARRILENVGWSQ